VSNFIAFRKGEVIMEEGSEGSLAYIITSGSAEVYKTARGKKIVLETLGPGNIVGEISLITGEPRRATVVALEDTMVTVLDRETFESAILQDQDTIIQLLQQVFRRLSYLDHMITAFYEKSETSDVKAAAGKPLQFRAVTKEAERALGKKSIQITKTPFFIGRASTEQVVETRDLSLMDKEPYEISRNHCVITFFRDEYYLLDAGSTVGTAVDNVRIGRKETNRNLPLKAGIHRVVLGSPKSKYVFELEIP
jgi:CRP-like cAMP-binding protein